MSKAFVKESDDEWLDQIPPTMNALILYLTRENNGIRVIERISYIHPALKIEVHEMSNGLVYALNEEEKWIVIDV